MKTATFRQVKITPMDEKIRRTVRIVHERFGGDIAAFIRDAREKREMEAPQADSAQQELETVASEN